MNAIPPPPEHCDNKWLDCWHHLALSYGTQDDGTEQVRLYVNGVLAAQRKQTGPVALVDAPFRLGTGTEITNGGTGIMDGRLDSWTLWRRTLSGEEIIAHMKRGLGEDDPAPADLGEVDLYADFDDPYPSIADTSHNNHPATVVNHGTPGVGGVTEWGKAFLLNSGQIVDAGWPVTTKLQIPAGTPSGMYAVQAVNADLTPIKQDGRVFVRSIAVRSMPDGPRAPIAVVLPTNTWTVYSTWSGKYDPGIPRRSRVPGGVTLKGGLNTSYLKLGDNVSRTRYHGLHRPSFEASPVLPGLDVANYTVRAANSMYLMQWFDSHGFTYDIYSDNDFDAGVISATDYRVLIPHSHNEYWTYGMLDALTRFLDDGGSVVAPAGNTFGHPVVYEPGGVVNMHRKSIILTEANLYSGIDGTYLGHLRSTDGQDTAYHGDPRFRALGVEVHYVHPCGSDPMFGGSFCLGYWVAQNTDHWLWQDSDLYDGNNFGLGRQAVAADGSIIKTFALGHEADTWVEDMPLPGLAPGQNGVILTEGTGLKNYCDRVNGLIFDPYCAKGFPSPDGKAGTILYFPHESGGHVLVIGASATPWALESDAALSGLMNRSLACFAYNLGCIVAEADFTPIRIRKNRGLFRIVAAATDPDGNLESLFAMIKLPSLEGLKIRLKKRKVVKVTVDPERGRARIVGPDPQALLKEIQNYGGLLVKDGQYTGIRLVDDSKYRLIFKNGKLFIKSHEVTLKAVAAGTNDQFDTDIAHPAFNR